MLVLVTLSACGGADPGSDAQSKAAGRSVTSSMGSPEPMPARLRRQLRHNGHRFSAGALPFAQSQRLGGPLIGTLWLVGGPRLTCIVFEGSGSSACDGSADVRRRSVYVRAY